MVQNNAHASAKGLILLIYIFIYFFFIVPVERNVFYRENADGAYSSHAFLASYMVK